MKIRTTVVVSLVAVSLLAIGAGIFLAMRSRGVFDCPFDRTTDPSVDIRDTQWTAAILIQSCVLGGASGEKIVAKNRRTGEERIIVSFLNIVTEDTSVSSSRSHSLLVTLPNRVAIDSAKSNFSDVHVEYRFLPRDDPQERSMYRRWVLNAMDGPARAWYCNNIWAKMDKSNRQTWNDILSDTYLRGHDVRHRYCRLPN